jgi:hypothetical protein
MYGVVLFIVFIAVAAAAMKDARLAKAATNPKIKIGAILMDRANTRGTFVRP